MQPSSGTIAPRFALPAGPRSAASALTLDPALSASTNRISSETWNFGDGTPPSFHAGRMLTSATHTYAAPGDYTATLTLVDNHGNLSTTSEPIAVGASPTAALTASSTQPPEGSAVSFDASGSSDAGASIVSYAWDFGDGAAAQGLGAVHTYTTAGTYLVRLTVTDGLGRIDTATSKITVLDEPPVAAFTIGAAVPEAGAAVPFDGSSSSDGDGSITRYAWNFGDGHTGTSATPSHAFASATGTGATASHAYASPGTYIVRLSVVDRSGASASASEPVTMHALPQSTFGCSPALPVEGTATAFSADALASDPAALVSSYAWSFGDGATAGGATVAHAYAHEGSYRVSLTVTDAFGLTATSSKVVSVVDAPPVGVIAVLTGHPVRGSAVALCGARSHDGDDSIVSFLWHFGDGSGAVGQRIAHTFGRAGVYRVSLTVRDSFGQTATARTTVTVARAGAIPRARRSHRRGSRGRKR